MIFYLLPIFLLVIVQLSFSQNIACNRTTIQNGVCVPAPHCSYIRNLIINNRNSLTEELKSEIRSYQCIGSEFKTIHVCCEKTILPTGYKCGVNAEDRIIRSHPAIDEYRWLARLEYEKLDGTKKFGCGGTIIHSRYILTSAECLVGKIENELGKIKSVRLGEYNIVTESDCEDFGFETLDCSDPVVDIDIEKVIAHPDFKQDNEISQNNIGLIKLSKEIIFTDFIYPICIDQTLEENTYNSIVSVVGWGQTPNEYQFDKKTKYVMEIIANRECTGSRDTEICVRKGISYHPESFLKKCSVDTGGPLMGWNPLHFVVGIASLSSGCGTANGTSRYTRVKPYVNWIISNID